MLKIENGYKKRLSCYLGALKEEEIGLEITGVFSPLLRIRGLSTDLIDVMLEDIVTLSVL